jgi:hypothetical protein
MKNMYSKTASLLILCGLALFGSPLYSQDSTASKRVNHPTKATTIGAFIASPVGNFGSTDINNGGFAAPGWGVVFDSKTKIKNGLSYVFHSTYSWMDIDQEAMSKEFSDYLGLKAEVDGGQHQPFLSTIGLNYDFYFTKRLKLGINGQAGVLYNSFRPFTLKVYDANNVLFYEDIVQYESAFAFAYSFGADLTFHLIKNLLGLKISADYSAGNLDTYLISKNLPPTKSVSKLEMLNLGIALEFYTP